MELILTLVGCVVGLLVGCDEGLVDGGSVRDFDGEPEGDGVGKSVGEDDGCFGLCISIQYQVICKVD